MGRNKNHLKKKSGAAFGVFLLTALLVAGVCAKGAPQTRADVPAGHREADWLQFNYDQMHSGNNTSEKLITKENVSKLRVVFRTILPAAADGAPVYLHGVDSAAGVRNLLFVTTKQGHIAAIDAGTGRQVWTRQHPAGPCRINNGGTPCYTTSSPVVDPGGRFVYTYGLDGRVHKHRVGGGEEITGGGWPQAATLKPFDEKGSSALAWATARNGVSYLYATNSGYLGDRGDYQGHVTAIDLGTGTKQVFNANCSNHPVHFVERPGSPDCPEVRSGIWARAGVVYDPGTDRVYLATGNGTFDPARFDWGDTVFSLRPDGTGNDGMPLDSYTPSNYLQLQEYDLDLGSSAPAVLPVPEGCTIRHLAVQGGKDRKLRLLDLSNLSGRGGPGHVGGEVGEVIDIPQGGELFTAPAVWVDPADGSTWVFIATFRGLSGMKLRVDGNGIPHLQPMWRLQEGASSPILANNVLYCAGSFNIRALEPATGKLLWRSSRIGRIHWESPIVVNGVLYCTDESGALTAFGLPSP
jgi:outer membrane protein assembly factor BamB